MPRWQISMLLVLVSVVFFFGFAYRFYAELDTINNEADISRRMINKTVNLSNEYIEMLSIFGETTLENNLPINGYQYSYINQLTPKDYGPSKIAVKSGKLDGGILIGKGTLPSDGPLKQEIEMALGYNRYFSRIKSSLPQSAWVHYISANRFQDIYPGIDAVDTRFDDLIYKKDLYYLGKPDTNLSHKRYWSTVYSDGLGKGLVTTVSKPIYDKGTFKGVVSIDLTVKDFSNYLSKDYYCFVMNQQNQIVAYSQLNPDVNRKSPLSVKDIFSDIQFVTLDPQQLMASPGKNYFIAQNAYVHSMKIDGVPWTLYVVQPLHMVVLKAITYSYPVLLIGILLLFAVYENAKVKHHEMQLKEIVTELEKSKKELERVSNIDPLSGTLNRRGMYKVLEDLAGKGVCSFILCDIDKFKQINDTFGHDVGDRMIQAVSEALKQNIREQDYISRWGGEEFLMFLPDTDQDTALEIARRLREQVEDIYIYTDTDSLRCTMSFGVSKYDCQTGLDRSIKNADIAMYRAKEKGRNNVCAYE